jgi:hypothetical protein
VCACQQVPKGFTDLRHKLGTAPDKPGRCGWCKALTFGYAVEAKSTSVLHRAHEKTKQGGPNMGSDDTESTLTLGTSEGVQYAPLTGNYPQAHI